MRVAVLGAKCTGKTQLAQGLTQAFAAWSGDKPVGDSQSTVLVSDCGTLMTAVYSDVLLGDASLYALALAQQRQFTLTLLMGLDLPWVADGIQRDGPPVQAQIDTRLRAVLDQHAIAYATVYGSGDSRLANALQAIAHHQDGAAQHPQDGPFNRPSNWQWQCEKCSDAACEHQLFSALVEAKPR